MMEKVKNIPVLRFPEFSGEWVEEKLGILSDVRDGTHDSPKPQKEGFPIITSKNLLKDGSLDFDNINLISENDFCEINKRSKVDIGDILFGMIGTIGNPVLLSRCDFAIKNVALIKEKNVLKNLFLIHYLKGQTIQKQFYNNNTGGTQKFLALGVVRNLIVFYPSNEGEQTRIASFLSSVDKKIEQLHAKKQLLEQYKKGMMQKLFSQQIRFKDENGNDYPDWEEKKLGDISTSFSGGTPTSSRRSYYSGNIPFIGSGNISAESVDQYITLEALKNSSAKIVENGDLLYALYGATSGEVAISKIKGAINQAILCIRTNEIKVYLYQYLLFRKEKILATFLQGGQGNLSAKIIKDLIINLPNKAEQTKIANFLSSVEDKINLIETELTKAKTFKKGLLQQMFV